MTGSYRQLSADEIRELLGELLDHAASAGIEIDAYLVGGAAMALHLGRSQLTPDVDGLFKPFEAVQRIGREMAMTHDLSPDWVNENARPFITFDPSDDRNFVETEIRGHRVRLASKRALLAMKMARYARKDYVDVSALIRDLRITSPDEIVDVTFDVLGDDPMSIPEGRADLRIRATDAIRRARG